MRSSANCTAVTLALAAGLLFSTVAGAADLDLRRHHHKRYRQVAEVEQIAYVPDACRVGWWQTVKFGHVQPRWAMRCR